MNTDFLNKVVTVKAIQNGSIIATLTVTTGEYGDAATLRWGRRGDCWRRRRFRVVVEGSDPPMQPQSSCSGSPDWLLQGHTRTGVRLSLSDIFNCQQSRAV